MDLNNFRNHHHLPAWGKGFDGHCEWGIQAIVGTKINQARPPLTTH